MTSTIEHSLIRIYNSYGNPAGVGFVIAPGKLLTRAHVDRISGARLDRNDLSVCGAEKFFGANHRAGLCRLQPQLGEVD